MVDLSWVCRLYSTRRQQLIYMADSQAKPHVVRESLHDQLVLHVLSIRQVHVPHNVSILCTSDNFVSALFEESWIEASPGPVQ